MLHGKMAASLATQYWTTTDDTKTTREYIIESSDIRRFYGPVIGEIASSHWWNINKVERILDRFLGAMTPKTQHEVDLLKIACLLRVADATHLDRRRAPPFVRALDRPAGISELHWEFQGRLAFPRISGDSLQYTAGEPCPVSQAGSWWLAFEAFLLADREIRGSDLLLRDRGRPGLKVRRVKGAENPNEMARHVPVIGWKPVETKLHISNVARIIKTLGGEKLYGTDSRAPLRELMQNAVDAVQARQRLRGIYDWGKIVISISDREDGIWLTVEDNGVGMSERVLTSSLLDFGSSFWRSNSVAEEFPSLSAKGMNSIGQFGIGFFSTFMLGDRLRVITKRFDRSYEDALQLDFFDGLSSRPILSTPNHDDIPVDGGTRVEIKLWSDPRHENYFELDLKIPQKKKPIYFI
jgi:hypothetical protein